jgi:hypothetical protein
VAFVSKKEIQPPVTAIFPIHLQKTSGTTEIEKPKKNR